MNSQSNCQQVYNFFSARSAAGLIRLKRQQWQAAEAKEKQFENGPTCVCAEELAHTHAYCVCIGPVISISIWLPAKLSHQIRLYFYFVIFRLVPVVSAFRWRPILWHFAWGAGIQGSGFRDRGLSLSCRLIFYCVCFTRRSKSLLNCKFFMLAFSAHT